MAGFTRIDLTPAYRAVSDEIERSILSGRLSPGDMLPSETEMAAQFGVNRHTLREGLRLLEQNGLLKRETGRRLQVCLPHLGELAPNASRALALNRVTFRELWEVQIDLEPSGAERAASRMTPEICERFEANLADTEAALNDPERATRLDIEFHALVMTASGNRASLLAHEPISLLFFPTTSRLLSHPKAQGVAAKRMIEAHRNIFEAIRRGEGETARCWMRKHNEDFLRGYALCGFDLDIPVEWSDANSPGSPQRASASSE